MLTIHAVRIPQACLWERQRNPTTYKVPITKERAFKEWDSNGMMDVREYSDYIDMNSYSGSDMW